MRFFTIGLLHESIDAEDHGRTHGKTLREVLHGEVLLGKGVQPMAGVVLGRRGWRSL